MESFDEGVVLYSLEDGGGVEGGGWYGANDAVLVACGDEVMGDTPTVDEAWGGEMGGWVVKGRQVGQMGLTLFDGLVAVPIAQGHLSFLHTGTEDDPVAPRRTVHTWMKRWVGG